MRAAAKALDTEKVSETAKAVVEAKAKAKAKVKGKPGRPKSKAKAKAQAAQSLGGDAVKAACSGDTDLEEEDQVIKAEMDLDMEDQRHAGQPGSDRASPAPKGKCRKAESMSPGDTVSGQEAKIRKRVRVKSKEALTEADTVPPPKAEREAMGAPSTSSSHTELPAPAPQVGENDDHKRKMIAEEVAKMATPQVQCRKEEKPKAKKPKKKEEWRYVRGAICFDSHTRSSISFFPRRILSSL